MAEIIPQLTREVLARMTAGEKRFAQRLRDFLEDDYLCWYDVPIGKKQRYPDFIILHPNRGLLFLEIKDWKAASLKKINKESVELLTDVGLKTVANPFVQVRQYAYQGIRLFESDDALKQTTGKHQGNLLFPYAYGVVFTNITRQQIETAIPEEYRPHLLPDHLMIYRDEMLESVEPEQFQQRLWNMFNHPFPVKLTLPQLDRIRWHLFPEVRIHQADQGTLFSDPVIKIDPELPVTTEQQIPEIIRIMDIQQEQLARSLGEGHRVIHGVAGSGKTLILGYRAEVLAKITQKPILILCFNITLAAKLRSMMQAKNLGQHVNIFHFHDWCQLQLKTYHVAVKDGSQPYFKRQVSAVIDAVEKGDIPRAQYSALLIDEGHDFEADWLKIVVQMIDPETNSLLLLYDDAQSIYKRKEGLGFSLASVGIQAQGRTTILKLNYRNTREILSFAYDFAKDFFADPHATESDIPLIEPEAAGISGSHPTVHYLKHWHSEIHDAYRCVLHWRQFDTAWQDIAILVSAKYQGDAVSQYLTQQGIPHVWLGSKTTKKAYNPQAACVTVLSIHSSKGLEFPNVIMLGISQLKREEDMRHTARLLYVGMTRAQQKLHLAISEKTPLTERILALAS